MWRHKKDNPIDDTNVAVSQFANEQMNATRIGTMLRGAAAFAAFLAPGASVVGEQPAFKVFYFGNSLLENSVPWFHPTLAATAGHPMQVQTQLGPGWQVWMHVDMFYRNPAPLKEALAK